MNQTSLPIKYPKHEDRIDPLDLYIDLLKRTIRNELYRDDNSPPSHNEVERGRQTYAHLQKRYPTLVNNAGITEEFVIFQQRRSATPQAHTLGDMSQVDNVERCVRDVFRNKIAGDFIEVGVFRGGMTILMAGMLRALGEKNRRVYVADSFSGWPKPEENHSVEDSVCYELFADAGSFASSIEEVRHNFGSYNLLDDHVVFVPGWFDETLPKLDVEKFAIIRIDADWYESTQCALENLYPRLSLGGYLVIDDYGLPIGCREAVDEYRQNYQVRDDFQWVNDQTIFWQKTHSV